MIAATCSCKYGKYLASIINDSVVMCNDIINAETKTVATNFNEKNAICKTKDFYILLAFLLFTIVLLIYCYLIEYKAQQKRLLPCYITNSKLILYY